MAAEVLIGQGPSGLTVRAVAAQAGVGVGTLRHHFPTQRVLHDAVLAAVYETAFPDDRIHDRSVSARDRLVECLRGMLAPVGTGGEAQLFWGRLFRGYLDVDADPVARSDYPVMHDHALRRIASWLSVLVEEGALDGGDTDGRARFLLTVVNGLTLERALPSSVPILETEASTLAMAIATLPFRDE